MFISRPSSLRRLSLALRSSRPVTRKSSPSSRISPYRHRGTIASHVFAGILGGGIVGVGGYAWYYFSPLRQTVETSKHIHKEARHFADNLGGRAIELLRKTIKANVAPVPAAGTAVDMAFDALGGIIEQHKEEIDQIAAKALREVQRLAEHGIDGKQTAFAILETMGTFLGEVRALGASAQITVGPLLENASREISLFASRLGPTMTEVQSTLSQGTSSVLRSIESNAPWFRESFSNTFCSYHGCYVLEFSYPEVVIEVPQYLEVSALALNCA